MDRAANNLAIGQFTGEGGTPEYGLRATAAKSSNWALACFRCRTWLSTGKSRIASHRSESSPLGSPSFALRSGKAKADMNTFDPAEQAFKEVVASANKEYDKAMAPAKRAYDSGLAPAEKAYDEAVAAARKAYDEAMAPAKRT